MRLTQVLCQQHISFMFKKHWLIARKRTPLESGVDFIKSKGINVVEANEFAHDKFQMLEHKVIGTKDLEISLDENHPDWKETVCYVHNETSALLDGLKQAQILTKSISILEALPEAIEEAASKDHPEGVHDQVKKAILSANVFDCEQTKLPKIKDPARPAHNTARILGIGDVRRNIITSTKLMNILEKNSDGIAKDRALTHDAEIVTSFERNGELLQFQLGSNTLITSTKPLRPATQKIDRLDDMELPDLNPVDPLNSVTKNHFYDFRDIYPIAEGVKAYHPHTTILLFNKSQVKNLYGSPVTENQILGRSLIHSFTVAAAYAKSLYGADVTLLPKPVTIQCIQSDGCNFYLGVLQLNTLDVNGGHGTKNIWFKAPSMKLFDKCGYVKAVPTLEGYNPTVYQYLQALYKNQ